MSWASALSLVAGFCSGVLAAVVGVGGAVITTPGIRFLGASPIEAVGSTVPAILPGALTGTIRYARAGLVDWRVALTCGGSGLVFAALGAMVSGRVNGSWLMIATAVLVLWSGIGILRGGDRRSAPTGTGSTGTGSTGTGSTGSASPSACSVPHGGTEHAMGPDRWFAPIGLGMVAGFLAGLLGIGGGIVLTPGLTAGMRMPVKRAIATSLVAVMCTSVTSLVTHWAEGHIDWRFALPLAVGIIPGAHLGSRVTIRSSDARMRVIAGTLLVVFAVVYLVREIVVW